MFSERINKRYERKEAHRRQREIEAQHKKEIRKQLFYHIGRIIWVIGIYACLPIFAAVGIISITYNLYQITKIAKEENLIKLR